MDKGLNNPLPDVEVNLEGTDVNELYDTMIDKVMENIANFQMQGSNWIFKSIIALEIHTVAYEPLRGSSYIPLPRELATKKAIINLKNQDDECFRWAVLRAINPTDKNPERIDKNLKSKRDQINMDGIEFQIDICEPNPSKSYTKQYQKHTPSSFCYYIKCFDDDVYTKDPVTYTAKTNDEDVAQKFVEMLEEDVKEIYKIPAKEMIFGETEREDFERATECWICQGKLKGDDRVRDHCHYTGKYRGAAQNKCNLKYKKPSFIPEVFHNLSGYDSHLFIKNLGASQGNIKCIQNNEEKYISLTKDVVIDSYTVKPKQKSAQKIVEKNDVPKKTTDATTDECEQDVDNDVDWESIMYGYDDDVPTEPTKSVFAEYYDNVPTADDESIFAEYDDDDSEDIDDEEPKKKNIVKQVRFIDSFRFMASSLDKLSSNLDKSCYTNTSRYYDGKQLELLLRKWYIPTNIWIPSRDLPRRNFRQKSHFIPDLVVTG